MAITVTADNTRVDDGEAATGYANIGSGPAGASEPSFPYQGSNLFNRKVTSSTGAGFYYDPTADSGAAQDMTATAKRTWMVKAIVTDYGGLQTTDGVVVRIGNDTSNYYGFIIAGSDSPVPAMQAYRPIGGLLVFPVDPNENSTYNDVNEDAGSVTLTAIDYFGLIAKFATASAKSENVGLDAIDLGTGLYLVGSSPDGVYQDFVDNDEGNTTNRYGYARNGDGGTILAYGNWRIGANSGGASATTFTDSDAVVLWLDGMFAAGFSVVTVNLGNGSTVVTDGCLHIGVGGTTGIDRRPDYTVTGTSGSFTFSGTLRNFRNLTFNSATQLDGADIEAVDMTQGTAQIENSVIRPNTASGVALCNDATFGSTSGINNCEVVQSGSGHFVELTSGSAFTFTNLDFSGFGGTPGSNPTSSSGANDAVIYNNTGGAVTISISGGSTPSIRNGAGATTIVQNTVTVRVTARDADDSAVVTGARVLLFADEGGDLPANDTVTIARSGSTATVTHTGHGLPSGSKVQIKGADQPEYNGVKTISNVTTNTYDFTVSGTPTTPATGTIKAWAVILDGTTDGSGIVQTTSFNYTSDQPVLGRVRRGTATPRYKTSPVSGDITSGGFTTTVFLIIDE